MSFAVDLILAQDGDMVVIPLAMVREIGLPAAAFLRQAAYLSAILADSKEEGWFFLEQEGYGNPSGKTIFERLGSWQHTLGIGPRAQASIRQQLIGLGLLEEKRGGLVHGKLRYRVDAQKYLTFLAQCGRASASHCFIKQPAQSDCANAEEQLHTQPAAGCTNRAASVDIYEVDLGSGFNKKKQQHAPEVRAFADAAASQGKQDLGRHRRRRGDEIVLHGIEIWTQEDERIVLDYVDRYGATRVEEVAKGLPVASGHVAPYRSVLVEAFQKLAKAEAQAAAEAGRQADAAVGDQRMTEMATRVDTFLQSLDEDARATVVADFGEWLSMHNKAAFQFYRKGGLQPKSVQIELRKFIHSSYLTQQEVAA